MSWINSVYERLAEIYASDCQLEDFKFHMQKLVEAGKSKEEAVLILALEKGLWIPEIEELLKKGMSTEKAVSKVAETMKIEASTEEKVEKLEETVKLKRKLFESPAPPPTPPARRLNLKTISWLGAFLIFSLIVLSVFVYGFHDAQGYTPAGIALISSIVFPIMLFLSLVLEGVVDDWRVSMNPWVRNVDEMDYWFNPMFFAWLYCHDKQRWAKYTIFMGLPFIFIFGILLIIFFLALARQLTPEALVTGLLAGAAFTTIFAIAYYQSYWKHM